VQGYAYQVSSLESGGYDLAFPISDRSRSIVASVALEGLLISLENSRSQIDQARKVVSPLQAIVEREGGALAPHYEHVHPDEIDLG
jgi:DNA-binding IclR family transcriptional regulator